MAVPWQMLSSEPPWPKQPPVASRFLWKKRVFFGELGWVQKGNN